MRTAKFVLDLIVNKVWPGFKKIRIAKKQSLALFLVSICGVIPLILLGVLSSMATTDAGRIPFGAVFSDKVIGCGNSLGTPENSTVSGIEKLFVLDQTFGSLSFAQAKTIDVSWDLIVGRGVQLLAWWAAYKVFSDALLRVIERHPASFRIFQRTALEGPSLLSLWTLTMELWVAKCRKTKALIFYMVLSISYVLLIPVFLGAMTGYDSTNIAWIDLDGTNNIVPQSAMTFSWLVAGTYNETFDQLVCEDEKLGYKLNKIQHWQSEQCDCKFPNGTILSPPQYHTSQYSPIYTYDSPRDIENCVHNYTGNTQTYTAKLDSGNQTLNCNSTLAIEIKGKTYDAQELNTTYGYCYNSIGYYGEPLFSHSRCLPDTANPSYKWGFATMMLGIFIFLQATWCVTMYAVWQDAQFNSTLVKSGYQMTPLRAVFAIAKAARIRTGLCEKGLVRADTKDLEKELYGTKKRKGTQVHYGTFVDDPEEDGEDRWTVRRRDLHGRHERGLSETALS